MRSGQSPVGNNSIKNTPSDDFYHGPIASIEASIRRNQQPIASRLQHVERRQQSSVRGTPEPYYSVVSRRDNALAIRTPSDLLKLSGARGEESRQLLTGICIPDRSFAI